MADFAPHDDRFEAGDWIAQPTAPPFTQRRLADDERIYCETVMVARGHQQDAVEKIRGPWTWWQAGRTRGFRMNRDGSTEQIVKPVWWYAATIGCQMLPTTTLSGARSGVRVAVLMSRHFVGLQTVDILQETDGCLTIRTRFHGVENHFPVGKRLVTPFHLRAESGRLPFPFPSDTGWIGLARMLSAQASLAHGDRP